MPIIGIGASAGGLESLEKLFRALPARTGAGFVVIQHLSPDFKSLVSQRGEISVMRADCVGIDRPPEEFAQERTDAHLRVGHSRCATLSPDPKSKRLDQRAGGGGALGVISSAKGA